MKKSKFKQFLKFKIKSKKSYIYIFLHLQNIYTYRTCFREETLMSVLISIVSIYNKKTKGQQQKKI